MDLGPIEYAHSGDALVAFQVAGTGPVDLLMLGDWVTPLEGRWDEPLTAAPLQRLASFSRVIAFDKRGIGLSDPAPLDDQTTPEAWVDDAIAVLDAAGSEQAILFGHHDGGHIAILLAATHPDRTSGLVLFNAAARLARADDYPAGMPQQVWNQWYGSGAVSEAFLRLWGSRGQMVLDQALPSTLDQALPSTPYRAAFSRWRRSQASPSVGMALMRMQYALDVRSALPAIRVPTLVLQRRDDGFWRADHGRYLAAQITGSRFVELPGGEHTWYDGEVEEALDEIEEFVTGARRERQADRALATVLFTDIVDSTARAAEMGDRAWRTALDAHDANARREIDRHRGRLVKQTGDGVLATFDGPARGIRCAVAIRSASTAVGLEVRAGLHTGEVELRDDDIGGIAVHISARVAALAGPGEVLVSRTVVDLVAGSGITFDDRGEHELKGVPDPWRLFAVE